MIKDRAQKKLALKFCAVQVIVPFTEVVVRSQSGLEENNVDITDVDVLGIELGRLGTIQRLLFDCKTVKRQSAINRALWACGLKSLVKADSVHIIQKKDAPDTHKLVANTFDVHIYSEDSFVLYANSIAPDFALNVSYLDDLGIWDSLLSLGKNEPSLADAVWVVTTQAALELSGPRGIRSVLATLQKVSGELDPARPVHRLLFGCYVSAFFIYLSCSASALKNVFQFSMDREKFELRLRYFVWEGRENYIRRSKLKTAIELARAGDNPSPLELPEWGQFVELMRSFLDAPEALAQLAYLSKEIAFRSSNTSPKAEADNRLRDLFMTNNRARQFLFATAFYLVRAAQLPKPFATQIESDVNEMLNGAPLK